MTPDFPFLRRAWRGARRFARILRWGGKALRGITPAASARPRRLLIIYDLASQPFSVGDILVFQEASLVLLARYDLQKVDMVIAYEPRQPVVPDPAFREIDAESFLFHLSSILPAAQVNPNLGSLLLFDSHRQLEAYVADNADSYVVWPSLQHYASRDYLFYHAFNDLFRAHFDAHGSLPVLQSRPAAAAWAARFVEEHVGAAVAVTVQLRRSRTDPARNSTVDAWLAFFDACASQYPAKFVVICARSEIDERLRGRPNVIVAKDHGTTLEQDLALLEAGACHMGASSGPGTMLLFGRKPYCMFSWNLKLDSIDGLIEEDGRHRFDFSTPMQSWLFEGETPELLLREFRRLWVASRGQARLPE
jgi:hypothetical protein